MTSNPTLDFVPSLIDLGSDAAVEIVDCLDDIAQRALTWDKFERIHGWEPLNLVGEQTYPGAVDLHRFYVDALSGNRYQIIGYTFQYVVVICAIALRN
ncbi:hypothetical protein Q4S45_15185 [Massilia sp. R2A-15]|uniref:hypothetical protein n=1 Tax=Massilia sp. R2A-15 TaxID=3064278 RepID=UPI0027376DB6|nr:hypothetical protein [Massilia sp. R2A-15]WLI88080.1 hypothetical protein Q4S45_15185 [Massilia sp. R2A-15]